MASKGDSFNAIAQMCIKGGDGTTGQYATCGSGNLLEAFGTGSAALDHSTIVTALLSVGALGIALILAGYAVDIVQKIIRKS